VSDWPKPRAPPNLPLSTGQPAVRAVGTHRAPPRHERTAVPVRGPASAASSTRNSTSVPSLISWRPGTDAPGSPPHVARLARSPQVALPHHHHRPERGGIATRRHVSVSRAGDPPLPLPELRPGHQPLWRTPRRGQARQPTRTCLAAPRRGGDPGRQGLAGQVAAGRPDPTARTQIFLAAPACQSGRLAEILGWEPCRVPPAIATRILPRSLAGSRPLAINRGGFADIWPRPVGPT